MISSPEDFFESYLTATLTRRAKTWIERNHYHRYKLIDGVTGEYRDKSAVDDIDDKIYNACCEISRDIVEELSREGTLSAEDDKTLIDELNKKLLNFDSKLEAELDKILSDYN